MPLPYPYCSSLAFVWTVKLNPKNSRTSSSNYVLLTEHTAKQTLLVLETETDLYEMISTDSI